MYLILLFVSFISNNSRTRCDCQCCKYIHVRRWRGYKINSQLETKFTHMLFFLVDGAIHHAAGDDLYNECKLHNGCPKGVAKATRGIFHTQNKIASLILCICMCRIQTTSKMYPTIAFILHLYLSFEDVIHTVGPIGEVPEILYNAYINCLKVAVENNIRTLVFLYKQKRRRVTQNRPFVEYLQESMDTLCTPQHILHWLLYESG